MKTKTIVMLLFISAIITGCSMFSSDILEVKKEENLNTKVTISGTVENTIKLGELSGYTLKDETGSIFVASETLPEEGSKQTVKGTVKKTLLGYYLETK